MVPGEIKIKELGTAEAVMADESKALVVQSTKGELVKASGADDLLRLIRPEWQAKDLIARVKRLLPVDPSSACQRILNAAIHDLRKKIVTAGLDVTKEAAGRFSLPSVIKTEDILESYSTTPLGRLNIELEGLSFGILRRTHS
jgi:hypothetical protein